jgi:hypothetical protein
MKEVFNNVLKRNAIVAGACLVLLAVLFVFQLKYSLKAASILSAIGVFLAFVWANRILWKHIHRWLAVLLAFIISSILTIALFVFFSQVIQPLIATGLLGMQGGCNTAMVQVTSIDVFDAERRLDEAKQTVGASTNEIAKLQAKYLAAQKRCEFWNEDVRRRGHRHWIPEYKEASPVQKDAE